MSSSFQTTPLPEVQDVPREIRRSARIIAPHTCIRWIGETQTMIGTSGSMSEDEKRSDTTWAPSSW